MLKLTATEPPSPAVQHRAKGMRAVKHDAGLHTISFRVGLIGKRFEDLVVFDAKRGVATCIRLKDGSRCEANANSMMCCHVWTACLELEAGNQKLAA
jgi:hypothetical protein